METKAEFKGVSTLYDNFESISKAHVCIIGIGGVGSWAAEALVRSGIYEITLIDLDEICVSNTNRQLHTLNTNHGKMKTQVMKERLMLINPDLKIHLIEDFVTPENVKDLITSKYDFVIDAFDSVDSKVALILHCKRSKIPFIVTGAAGGKKDPSKIIQGDLNQTIEDKLIFQIRKILRREHGFSRNRKRTYKVPTIYSTETTKKIDPTNHLTGVACDVGLGSSVAVTASFGMMTCSYVLNYLTKNTK